MAQVWSLCAEPLKITDVLDVVCGEGEEGEAAGSCKKNVEEAMQRRGWDKRNKLKREEEE